MFFQTFEDRGQWRSVRDGIPWDRKPVRWAPQWLTTTQFTSWKEFPDCAKLNSQWLTVVNISHDTIKLLEKITGKTFSDINHTNVLLGQSPKAVEINAKINKWDLIKLTNFCRAKKTINKTKRQPTEWEKMFVNSATDKGLISKILYVKSSYNWTTKEKNKQPNRKMGRRLK